MPKVADAHLAARRQSILEAACRVFCSKGVSTATMADVAAEAGISPGAIYRYFHSKDDLVGFCLADAEAIHSRWKLPPEPGEDPLQEMIQLARLTFSTLSNASERSDTILMLEQILAAVRQGDQTALDEIRDEHRGAAAGIAQRLTAAKAKGEIPADLDAGLFAQAMLSFYWGSRITRLVDAAADTSGHLDQLMSVLIRAGGAPAGA